MKEPSQRQLLCVATIDHASYKYGGPEESLTAGKVQRLIAASQDYLQEHDLQNAKWRIDLVCVRLTQDYRLEGIEQLKHAVQG